MSGIDVINHGMYAGTSRVSEGLVYWFSRAEIFAGDRCFVTLFKIITFNFRESVRYGCFATFSLVEGCSILIRGAFLNSKQSTSCLHNVNWGNEEIYFHWYLNEFQENLTNIFQSMWRIPRNNLHPLDVSREIVKILLSVEKSNRNFSPHLINLRPDVGHWSRF